MRPPDDLNFCRVFELPDDYPKGFLFQGSKPVEFRMVDWFNPWPPEDWSVGVESPETWEQVVEMLRPWLGQKRYAKPGKKYILITDFGESFVFTGRPKV